MKYGNEVSPTAVSRLPGAERSGRGNRNEIDGRLSLLRSITGLDIEANRFDRLVGLHHATSRIQTVQAKYECDIVGVFVFLFVGAKNVGRSFTGDAIGGASRFLRLRPVSIKHISDSLLLNRETARRRLIELEQRGFLARFDQGFVVRDWTAWTEMMRAASTR